MAWFSVHTKGSYKLNVGTLEGWSVRKLPVCRMVLYARLLNERSQYNLSFSPKEVETTGAVGNIQTCQPAWRETLGYEEIIRRECSGDG